jgi:hypothetical protein
MTIQYLAGIIDGEGYFYRQKARSGNGYSYDQSRVVVVNTCKPLIDALKAQLGGNVSPMKSTLGHKQCYRWQLAGKKCEELARQLQPYLLVKAEQVKRVLA